MFDENTLLSELYFRAVRSSGSGGQHVNKVATKVELYFDLKNTSVFDEDQKIQLEAFFKNRLSKLGIVLISCDETRSQFKNKSLVIERFLDFIKQALKEEKERISTKIPKTIIKKRLENKRRNSAKKANRKKPDIE